MRLDEILNTFICGRCEEVLSEFPASSVNLIITSPPYADVRNYGIDDSKIKADNYIDWFLPKARQFKRVLANNGSFILNINDKVVSGEQHLFVHELVIALVKEIGFKYVRDYIWYNPAAPPNAYSRGTLGRTKKSHEYCFWFSISDTWTFNLDAIRKPYSKDMQKYLDGNGKGGRRSNKRPSTHSFNCERQWPDHGGSDPGSVIMLANTSSTDEFTKLCKVRGIRHPARFPEKLAEFFVLSGSNIGDIVLDPFSGSGTTAISAHRNNRNWIGIDANSDYCDISRERMVLEFAGVKSEINK